MNTFLRTYRVEILKGVFSVVAALLLALFFVHPIYKNIAKVQEKTEQARVQLKRQGDYMGDYEAFKSESEPGAEAGFPLPDAVHMSPTDMISLPDKMEQVVARSGMTVMDVVLSPSSLRKGNGRIKLTAILGGTPQQFGEFYLGLAAMGEMAWVDHVSMQAVPGGMEYLIEFWLHIGEGRG